jgi:hypothetical protein
MQHEPPRDGQTCTISHSVSNSGPVELSNTDDVKDRRCARLLPNGPHKRRLHAMGAPLSAGLRANARGAAQPCNKRVAEGARGAGS